MNIKRKLSSGILGAAVLVSSLGGAAALAAPASAAPVSAPKASVSVNVPAFKDGIYERCEYKNLGMYCLTWRNYNWWEETFLRQRDGWTWVYVGR